jgi:hypothetical protein
MNIWIATSANLLTDLLYEMATCLGHTHFNKAKIKSDAYVPRYFADIENEQNELRKAAIEVFRGKQRLRVEVEEPPQGGLPRGVIRH